MQTGSQKQPAAKQYQHIAQKPVLRHSIEAFSHCPAIDRIVCVIAKEDQSAYQRAIRGLATNLAPPVLGGASRQASVFAGLESLRDAAPEKILIHDGVRPFICRRLLARIISAIAPGGGAAPGLPVFDSLCLAGEQKILKKISRQNVLRLQTPQGFCYQSIYQAHQQARQKNAKPCDDDVEIALQAGMAVTMVAGTQENLKLTVRQDMEWAEQISPCLANFSPHIGIGYDAHEFCPGDNLRLCGVTLAHHKTLAGHSDADVALHALSDAILGAAGLGDIGMHFPPSDPRWKNMDSQYFLRKACAMLRQNGGKLVNLDVTIIAQEPKIAPYRDKMRVCVAKMAGLCPEQVNIKATTTEGMGFTGRGEGIGAQAVAAALRIVGNNSQK